jgi:hypothetical protein
MRRHVVLLAGRDPVEGRTKAQPSDPAWVANRFIRRFKQKIEEGLALGR